MPPYPYLVLALGSTAWFLPLLLQKRRSGTPQKVDRRARWGILLVGAGYAIPWQCAFWVRPAGGWRAAVAAPCFVAACAFSWTAARSLGRHWRIEAGLVVDHELVQSGVYGLVRHPIYTSMLFVIVATCLILAPLSLLPVSVLLYLLGTEIRVRAEEALLSERFGETFAAYRRRVPAYVPRPWLFVAGRAAPPAGPAK